MRTAVSNALRRATHVLGARSGDDFERVSAERVVRHWLTRELDAAADDEHGGRSTVDDEHGVPTPTGTEPPPSTGLADRQLGGRSTADTRDPDSPRGTPSGVGEDGQTRYAALVDALLSVKPGAATFLGRHPPSAWYRTTLSPERLSRLHPVAGPPDLSWRAVATDGTLASVARRRHHEGPAPLRRAGVDVEAVDHYTERLAAGDTLDAVVIRTDRGATPWLVADGNHRVVAAARHRLASGEYEPLPAFVGVSSNSVLEPLLARLRGLRRRLRGRRVAEPRR
ncbi:hypothetical protein RYH80_17745 [Halobaculum sp. MBLA0147]|uniref:hypothetical protein n=1 Tax=Halobaculum sp. MBLA0147 TaxID=3079934 RepID=UPI00352624C0